MSLGCFLCFVCSFFVFASLPSPSPLAFPVPRTPVLWVPGAPGGMAGIPWHEDRPPRGPGGHSRLLGPGREAALERVGTPASPAASVAGASGSGARSALVGVGETVRFSEGQFPFQNWAEFSVNAALYLQEQDHVAPGGVRGGGELAVSRGVT